MADITFAPSDVGYATGGGSKWTSGLLISGVSGSENFRSRLTLHIGDLNMSKSTRLVVKVTLNTISSPAGCYGVLHPDGDIPIGKVVSDTYNGGATNGPHPDLLTNAIAESYPYEDAEGTILHTGTYNKPVGFSFYFVFNTEDLQPNTDYYIYVMRNVYTGCGTTSGFTQAALSGISLTLTYEPTYSVELNHCLVGADGKLTWYSRTTYRVDAGASYTPVLITPPSTHTAEGATFKAWVIGWTSVVGEGVVGEDYVTVNEDLTFEVYYPLGGSYVYVNRHGVAIKCEMLENRNGTATRCEITVNVHGTAVKI